MNRQCAKDFIVTDLSPSLVPSLSQLFNVQRATMKSWEWPGDEATFPSKCSARFKATAYQLFQQVSLSLLLTYLSWHSYYHVHAWLIVGIIIEPYDLSLYMHALYIHCSYTRSTVVIVIHFYS